MMRMTQREKKVRMTECTLRCHSEPLNTEGLLPPASGKIVFS
jgi:hypothetical protein